jgi:precorrin-6Y C5,15-methyltransferase (decarboxylating)
MIPVKIIGMGMGPDDLTAKHQRLIAEAEIIVGGRRHLWNYADHPACKIVIGKNVKSLIRQVAEHAAMKSVVVLASGDPLFYGVGKIFADALGKDNVEIYPNICSVAGAFARLKESWNDAGVISLHGRDVDSDIVDAIRRSEKVAVFTDPKNNPSELAKNLWGKGLDGYRICVLEQMGSDSEAVSWHSLEEAAGKSFSDPNMVVLKKEPEPEGTQNKNPVKTIGLGMPDQAFAHTEGLITKAEVRVVSLSRLSLSTDHVMWDLGAGSGSVSIEAAGFVKVGRIFAVEKNGERISQIRENIETFGAAHVVPVMAELPDGMDHLPDPDRIFVGGGGKNLEDILTKACGRLKKDGVVVVNTVLLGNVHTALTTLENLGFETDIVQIQVSSGHAMPWNLMLKAGNPVFVIRGKKCG